MKVAVLCSGPSLLRTWHCTKAMQYRKVIAVNYAIDQVTAGVLVQADGVSPSSYGRIGEAVYMFDEHARQARISNATWAKQLRETDLEVHSILDLYEWAAPSIRFSYQAALRVAAIHADVIDVYGCDQSGDGYCNGAKGASTVAGTERWPHELQLMVSEYTWLQTQGVRVTLVGRKPDRWTQMVRCVDG